MFQGIGGFGITRAWPSAGELLRYGGNRSPMNYSNLLPLVRRRDSPDFAGQDKGSEASPVTQPLVGELLVAFAFALPGGLQWLTRGQFQQLGLTEDELRQQSQEFFLKGLSQLKGQPLRGTVLGLGPDETLLTTLKIGNSREASLLLLEHVWNQLGDQLQDEVVVAVPSEDRLMFTGLKNSTGLLTMARLAEQAFRDSGSRALSPDLLVWRQGWTPLDSAVTAGDSQPG